MSFKENIEKLVRGNENFRKVINTGAKSQLVVMTIPVGGEIGEEVHEHVEQTIFLVEGSAETVLEGSTSPFTAGDVLVVTPNTRHNVKNVGDTPLRLYTVYAPPNHIDGRIHATKEDADKDHEDEEFGKKN